MMMTFWIDTHCHLDATEFESDAPMVRARAAMNNVAHCILPAIGVKNFEAVRTMAYINRDSYALGIHPLCVKHALDEDLNVLDQQLQLHQNDPRLVAVGEIGIDLFEPEWCISPLRERQEHFYREQLKLAKKYGLPVILHVRRSADQLLKGLRDIGGSGIAHAFNGSLQQAQAFTKLGFRLGFGGAVTYERALQLRRLAAELPLEALVLETDAPDMPPHWLYLTAQQRATGTPQGRNEPAELPRIGAVVANLRGMEPDVLADATTRNACTALPKLRALLV
jgi:TatD DNase family protein